MKISDLKQYKKSDRIYILGSGKSVLDITKEEWKEIRKHDSIGFNHWYVHEFIPTFYDLSYLANDYFEKQEDDMFYQASQKCQRSIFILNNSLDPSHLELFKDRTYVQTYINHFDFFEGNLDELEITEDTKIGKLASYWSTEFFNHFNEPLGELLPNDNFIFKSRGQLFATIQIAVLLGYKDIRLIGVDLNNENKFQDYYSNAPASARSVGNGGEHFKPRMNAYNSMKDKEGVHNTAQGTKDKDYLGIHKLLRIFKEKCLNRVGVSLTVCNSSSLLITENIKYQPIIGEVQMEKITFCIPTKTNLRYLKKCIPSIRKNAYRKDHDIFIFVDEDKDGTVSWLEEVKDLYNLKYYVNPKINKELYGIGRAYDFCIEKSTTDIFMIFHADMMLGKHADFKLYQQLKPKTVMCSTRIEPPLHPNAGEKILIDFGIWPEDFKEKEFDEYVEEHLNDSKRTNGIFAPWMMYKEEFLEIGGHDPRMHSCREDSDVFNRLFLDEFTFIQSWNSLVYHLTGRGAGSFDGDKERHAKWKDAMMKSTREFIRKWGSGVLHTPLLLPIVFPKYNIKFNIKNCSTALLANLEPWADSIVVDCDTEEYINYEQEKTVVDLSSKLEDKDTDITVNIDGKTFTQDDFKYIQQLGGIIRDSGEVGEFELGNLFIKIEALNEYQNNLIKL